MKKPTALATFIETHKESDPPLTQALMAAELGISRQTINAWCSGKASPWTSKAIPLVEFLKKWDPTVTVEGLFK